jgi:hypothetical protein
MDTGPTGRLVHPRLYFRNSTFSLAHRAPRCSRD